MCATSFSAVQITPSFGSSPLAGDEERAGIVPVHLGHVRVEQHGIGHLTKTGFERLLAILGFRRSGFFQTLENRRATSRIHA